MPYTPPSTGGGMPAPDPMENFTFYVDKSGSDTTGNGSVLNPWLTIQFAINTIDSSGVATNENPCCVKVGAGKWEENLTLKRYIQIIGVHPLATELYGPGGARLEITTDGLSGDWSGIRQVGFAGVYGSFFDLLGYNPKMYIWDCVIKSVFSINNSSGGVDGAIIISNCNGSGIEVSGERIKLVACDLASLAVSRYQSRKSGFEVHGSAIKTTVLESSLAAVAVDAKIYSGYVGTITTETNLGGLSLSYAISSVGSITSTGAITLNTLGRWQDVPYSPAVTGDWTSSNPPTVWAALDRIAASIGPIA